MTEIENIGLNTFLKQKSVQNQGGFFFFALKSNVARTCSQFPQKNK